MRHNRLTTVIACSHRGKVNFPVRFKCEGSDEEGMGKMIDVSASGGGLIVTTEALRPGIRLELWLEIPDGRDPLYIRGIVVWTTMIEKDLYRVGVQFDEVDFMGISRVLRVYYPSSEGQE